MHLISFNYFKKGWTDFYEYPNPKQLFLNAPTTGRWWGHPFVFGNEIILR